MKSKAIREMRALCEELGLKITELIPASGSHYKIKIKASDGRIETFMCTTNMGDKRAQLNKRADLRAFAEGRKSFLNPRRNKDASITGS